MVQPLAQLLAEMTTAQLVFLGGLILLVGILSVRARRAFGTATRRPRAAGGVHSEHSPRAHHEKPAESQQWEVEMHELARELSARLDSKMVALQQLIRDADAATARLEAATNRPGPARGVDDFGGASQGGQEEEHPADAFHAAYAPTSPTSLSASEDPRYRNIYALADQGLSREAIARRVGTPAGEVDLILALRGKGRS